jgi:hypothetical protein
MPSLLNTPTPDPKAAIPKREAVSASQRMFRNWDLSSGNQLISGGL